MSYGSNLGVAALVPRDVNAAGRFDHATTPTDAQVTAWRSEISAMLDVALGAAGIPTPVTDATITPALALFVNGSAAWLVESVNGRGRFEERPATTQEILAQISLAAAEWPDRYARGLAALLNVVPDIVEGVAPPVMWRVVNYDTGAARTGGQ